MSTDLKSVLSTLRASQKHYFSVAGLSEPQVRILMRLITASPAFNAAAGSIDVAEFLGRFKVVYSNSINEE